MSHTNATTYYGLPQFITTDKPAWLTDVNTAYGAIDTGIHNAKVAADTAQGDATQALSDAASALSTANTADGKGSGAVASIAETFSTTDTYAVGDLVIYNNLLYRCIAAINVPGAWSGASNWSRVTLDTLNTESKAAIANITSNLSVHNPSPAYTISKESGEWSIVNIDAKRSGNIVALMITIQGSGNTVNAGENGFRGNITNGALPIISASSISHRGSNIIFEFRINSAGVVYVRVMNNNTTIGANETITFETLFMVN